MKTTTVKPHAIQFEEKNTFSIVKDSKKYIQKNIEILYGYEPLCGWCYGFSDELEKTIRAFDNQVNFKLVNGGIFAGLRGLKMEYISKHIKNNMGFVTQRSGKKFGPKFIELLENDNYSYDSTKASIAVAIVRDLLPEKTFEIASKIQTAFFQHGKDIQNNQTYLDILSLYNIDLFDFSQKLESDYYKKLVEQEFIETKKIGFNGYPSAAIKVNDQIMTITEGYVSFEEFTKIINTRIQDYLLEKLN